MRVPWTQMSPSEYEDMVAVLISLLHPTSRRIDGSGGDGGRDIQMPLDQGLHVFELKSFTGRLTNSHRRQVKRSLSRAALLKPAKWTLVVPIDPTPSELQWFDGLRDEFSFDLEWRGLTWLEGQVAQKPFLYRYFVEGGADEAMRLLKDLREEEAALAGGLPQALDRARRLAERLNELDPYYRFAITVDGDTQSVAVMPRFAGAEDEKPIEISLSTSFPDTVEGREAASAFREFMDFGTPVQVSGEFISSFDVSGLPGLVAVDRPQLLKFGPAVNDRHLPMEAELVVLKPNDVADARLPITFLRRSAGQRGVILHGEDKSGSLHVKVTVEVESRRVNINFRYRTVETHWPSEVLPATHFAAAMRPPNMFKLMLLDREVTPEATPVPEPILDDDLYVTLLEHLARLQEHAHVYFPIPEGFTASDQDEMAKAVALIDGEEVVTQWDDFTLSITRSGLKKMVETLSTEGEEALVLQSEIVLHLFDKELPLGEVRMHFPTAKLSPEAMELAQIVGDPEEFVSVKVVAGTDKTVHRRLVTPERPGLEQGEAPSESAAIQEKTSRTN